MFTGIIQAIGVINGIESIGTNKTFSISSSISNTLKVDQSVAHNGVCLTVETIHNQTYRVTAIDETLQKSNLGSLQTGDEINLETCLTLQSLLDGHIVQGHVDGTATCVDKVDKNGSVEFTFEFDEQFAPLVIEKGSIAVNGISLTAFNVATNRFTVAIIPYTLEHTNIKYVQPASVVNIEFDMVGKYVVRNLKLK